MNVPQPGRPIVSVIGSHERGASEPIPDHALAAAEEVGRLVAQSGGILLTGGKGGIMEAASRGANLAGGIVVGLLPSHYKAEANRYVTVPLPTGLEYLRNYLTIRAADVVLMVCGSRGTMHEAVVAYGHKPLIVLEGTGGWSDRMRQFLYEGLYFDEKKKAPVLYASTPEQAVRLAFEVAAKSQNAQPAR